MLSNISSASAISFVATPRCPRLIAFNSSKSSAWFNPCLFVRVRLYRLVDFTAPRWAPCKKRKLACCNFNALILETGTNRHNFSALEFSHTNSKTCRTSTYKISHMIYIYHSIKGITKWSPSKCQSNDSDNPYSDSLVGQDYPYTRLSFHF